jgi:hypothetical protein
MARMGKAVSASALILVCGATFVRADPIGWSQLGGPGSPVYLSYSYSNLLQPGFHTTLTPGELRSLTEFAFTVWTRHAPINFIEVEDSGPAPGEDDYDGSATSDIRIGYQPWLDGDLAHAHFPFDRDGSVATGLGGDIHIWNEPIWGRAIESALVIDFFSMMLHETGHALGILHIFGVPAVMSGNLFRVEPIPENADLLPADIAALHKLYGSGVGSVLPLDQAMPTPEPATLFLLTAGVAAEMLRRRRAGRRPSPRLVAALLFATVAKARRLRA